MESLTNEELDQEIKTLTSVAIDMEDCRDDPAINRVANDLWDRVWELEAILEQRMRKSHMWP